jgi:hypothetical protein
MATLTDDQIRVLATFADNLLAEETEIAARNNAVNTDTANLEALKSQIADLAAQHGVDPTTYQLQAQPAEAADEVKAFAAFSQEAADAAKAAGLDDFIVKSINP